MYTLTNIVEKLNFFDIDCDCIEVEQIVNELKIEPVSVDKSGQLLYDDEAYELVKSKLEEWKPLLTKTSSTAKEAEIVTEQASDIEEEKTSVVFQKPANIEIIAKTISKRITIDLAEYIRNNMSTEEAFKAGIFKRDNEILSKRLQETIKDNKKLIEKIRELENENRKYRPVFGSFYVKDK